MNQKPSTPTHEPAGTAQGFDDAVLYLLKGENATCFECGQQSMWASVSLGITLCIVHAGKHRALGTHLSKVRSLTLDTWDKKNLLFLELGGNKRAESVFSLTQDSIQEKYSSKSAEQYRQTLRQEVGDALGVPLEDENKPITLDPQLQKFANSRSIGSNDFNGGQRKVQEDDCSCCNIL